MSSNKKATPSGIITTENNERVIPASRRPDGTVRKERRVRSGFTPQEDVVRYKNKNIAEPVLEPEVLSEQEAQKKKAHEKNKKRNAKKKEKNREKVESEIETKESSAQEIDGIQEKIADLSITSGTQETNDETTQSELISKKIKALEKKIRQIDRIKEKEASGMVLLEDERSKLNRSEQIQEELENLKRIKDDLE